VYDFFLKVPQTTIAANGDVLLFSGNGRVRLFPFDAAATTFTDIWDAEFVVVGGTGRFVNAQPAQEPVHAVAINDPFTFLESEWTFT
jgi:hypothetical protein